MTTPMSFPDCCPACGTKTTNLIATTAKATGGKPAPGRHCQRDSFEGWRDKCRVLVCTCGVAYTNYPHHFTTREVQ